MNEGLAKVGMPTLPNFAVCSQGDGAQIWSRKPLNVRSRQVRSGLPCSLRNVWHASWVRSLKDQPSEKCKPSAFGVKL